MTLTERLNEDLKRHLKARETTKLEILRTLLAAVKNARIEKGSDLSEEEILRVIQKEVKQRKESREQFAQGGRDDLVAKEVAALELLEAYLPQQMSSEELRAIVKQCVDETGASSVKDMGRVMKAVMAKTAGRAEGSEINKLVREILG